MTIINSIIARKNGQASHQVEGSVPRKGALAILKGHSSDQPGLRAHSRDDLYPYGVTGYGKRWVVTYAGQPYAYEHTGLPIITKKALTAHEIAGALAKSGTAPQQVHTVAWEELS